MQFRTGILAAVAAAFFISAGGCANTSKQTAERDSLLNQNKELQEQLQAERAARIAADNKASAMSTQLSTTPVVVDSTPSMGGVFDTTGAGRPTGRGGSTPVRTTTPTADKIASATTRVTVPGEVLFDSGKVSLSAAATKTLDTIAATIKKQYPGQKLVIEGFTDSTPIKSTTTWKSNEDLAAARATAVKKYLAKKGISEADMTIEAMGAVDSKTTKNPALARKVEVVVLKSAK